MSFNRGLMLLMTFERWVVICRPFSSFRKFKQTIRLYMSFSILAFWSILLNIPMAWENDLVAQVVHENRDNNTSSFSTSTLITSPITYRLVSDADYACNIFYQYLYRFGLILGLNIIVPIFVMIVFNGMAIYVLMRSREAVQVRAYF